MNMARNRQLPEVNNLKTAVAKEFRGGLNTFDSALNLNPRYLTELRNLYPDSNGRLQLRYGTSIVAAIDSVHGAIIAMEYYNARLVLVTASGRILTMTGAGAVSLRWSSWSATTRANFTQFDGKLVIVNGVDKPVYMNETYNVALIGDPGNGNSNVNVPRAAFCATHNQYLVLATGATPSSVAPSTLFIASRGTLATMVGDPGVDNDAVNYIISRSVSSGDPAITGLVSFRDRLLVATAECIVPMVLGEYEGTKHKPRVDDVIESFGAASQRAIVAMGDDVLLLDPTGVASVQRAIVTGSLSPVRESTLIARDMQNALKKFTTTQLANSIFAVHDRIAQQVMFFVPKDATGGAEVDNDVFVYCFDRSQKFRAWTYFDGMSYRCGCRSAENRVFLASAFTVFLYHNQYEPHYMDAYVSSRTPWDDGTMWSDGSGWLEAALQEQPWSDGVNWSDGKGWEEELVGQAIPFAMSTTWTEFKEPARIKHTRYMHAELEGAGNITVRMFIDRIATPALEMPMQVNAQTEMQGAFLRPTNTGDLYAWPAKMNRAKLQVTGQATEYLAVVSLSLMYSVGSIRR